MDYEILMREALAEARRGWGQTHPNPMVGSVIVENGEIVARGYHARAGEAHAERAVLNNLGRRPKSGAVLVVTLEPCNTEGRTPPCTEAILESGIRKVVVGAVDPNPKHAGVGLDRLRAAGIEVVDGILEGACTALNLIFNHWIVEGTPFITGKLAMTVDGKIAAENGQSQWITGPQARADVMRWRRYFPAIGVGANTVLLDNPKLTSRIEGEANWCPQRFVFDRNLSSVGDPIPHLYADAYRTQTTVVTSIEADREKEAELIDRGVGLWRLPEVTPEAFARKCVEEQVYGVLIEGGGYLLSDFLNQGYLNYLLLYKSPKILGDPSARPGFTGRRVKSMEESLKIINPEWTPLGEDILLRGVPEVKVRDE